MGNKNSRALDQSEILNRFKQTHGNKYDYSLVEYKNKRTKVNIKCKIHGLFEMLPDNHIRGANCPKCAKENKRVGYNPIGKYTQEIVLSKFEKTHGTLYDYSLMKYIRNDIPVKIICKIHGVFEQNPWVHWSGGRCQECMKSTTPHNKIIERLNEVNPYNHTFDKVQYKNMHTKVIITCKEHGDFKRTLANYFTNYLCPKCNPQKSKYELELEKILNEQKINILLNDRKFINPLEIDILAYENNFGIEFNGLMFHSYGYSKFEMFNNFKKLDKNKHIVKTNLIEEKGFQLFHILDIDWENPIKKEIWKSIINSKIGKIEKVFARNTKIEDLSNHNDIVKSFLNNNHLQGYSSYKYAYGLINKFGRLITLMTFDKSVENSNEWELKRFCNFQNTAIVGGASKLLKYFERVHKPKSIVSYAKRDWSKGDLYVKLGFTLDSIIKPNSFYFNPSDKILQSLNDDDIVSKVNNNYRVYFDSGELRFKKELE